MAFSIIFGQAVSTEPMNYLDTMFGYVGNMGVMKCAAGGTANAIVLTPNTNQPTLLAYTQGQCFSFVATANNTGNVTVNIGGVGSIPILQSNGSQLAVGMITGGAACFIVTDGVGNAWLNSGNSLPSDLARTDVDTQWTARVDGPATVQLSFASTTSWAVNTGNTFQLVLTANTIMAAPTGMRDAQTGILWLTQDSTGGRTVSWNGAYDFGAAGAPTLSTGASKSDRISFSVLGTSMKMGAIQLGY